MSLYNSPKEHKLRKPRAGFEKIKKQHWDDLNTPKEEIEMKPAIELSEQAKLRIKKKRRRSLLIQLLVLVLVLIPLTLVVVNFFYAKVDSTHKKLAPHHYEMIPTPHLPELYWNWKKGYTAIANKDYDKAIFYFNDLNKKSSTTTFGLTGLISIYYERCKDGHNSSCDLLFESLDTYKVIHHIKGDNDSRIIGQVNAFTEYQIKKAQSE